MEELPDSIALILAAAGYITLIGGTLAALTRWVFQPAARAVKQIGLFLEQWFGEDPTTVPPGEEPRTGVLDRLARLEARQKRTEWHTGNGDPVPLRAVVNDIAGQTDELLKRLRAVEDQVETVELPTTPEER